METTNLGLEQPTYLSDGETAVNSINTNLGIIDALFTYFVFDSDGTLVIDGKNGTPIMDIAL